MADDPHDLARFLDAQGPVYARVVAELRAGRKTSHWMWFVFPQIEGLGHSAMARRYAIGGAAEARAYLAHPVLGPRLRACTALVNAVEGRSITAILGSPDDLKFRSAVTLFGAMDVEPAVFRAALDRYFGGAGDQATLQRLGTGSRALPRLAHGGVPPFGPQHPARMCLCGRRRRRSGPLRPPRPRSRP